ncbi:MAG TPA: dual specificity protein phosphatase family protein [Methanomassiliicoccales archaeon]|nr:dual specificity protein phosphatase family protein [Methanomassiliicoccales archaeon]
MDWIDEYVAVGSWKSVFFIDDLKKADIDLIIDARTLFDVVHGNPKKPLVSKVLKAGDMLVALTKFNAKVLVHCSEGIDRTPFLAMIYVSKRYDMPYKEAYELVKEKRPGTNFHWDWVEMLGPRERGEVDINELSMDDDEHAPVAKGPDVECVAPRRKKVARKKRAPR